uniref:Uncharacterized protein n=1 Tax=Anguilla anguilla TaxID=7936 RepID=A0A0E9QYI9_ANGAN
MEVNVTAALSKLVMEFSTIAMFVFINKDISISFSAEKPLSVPDCFSLNLKINRNQEHPQQHMRIHRCCGGRIIAC